MKDIVFPGLADVTTFVEIPKEFTRTLARNVAQATTHGRHDRRAARRPERRIGVA